MLFLKGLARGLKLKLKLLYIDETAFKLINSNYYQWREKNELIFGGAEKELKKQLNMIAEMDGDKIIDYQLENNPINSQKFIKFLDKMFAKIGENNINNYLIIIDNAKCHISKTEKNYAIKKIKNID